MMIVSPKKHVLIVDDCPIFIKLVSSLLAEDFLIQAANSGEEAIELLKCAAEGSPTNELSYDLIITDLDMPGLSGFDVADYVRDKNKKSRFTPVIMLTGLDITKEEARKHGCAAFVPKADLSKIKFLTRTLVMT